LFASFENLFFGTLQTSLRLALFGGVVLALQGRFITFYGVLKLFDSFSLLFHI